MASVRPDRPPIREGQLALINEILTDTRKYNVCYTPEARIMIELHLQRVLTCYTSLSIKYEEYTYNDGRTVGMIKMTGTIPITYGQRTYNIPVTLWISEHYPQQPPIAYVTPTQDMIIKENHAYVDASGYVRTPTCAQWHGDSELVEVVDDMVRIFSQDPPLFAKVRQRPVTQYPTVSYGGDAGRVQGHPTSSNPNPYGPGQQQPGGQYSQSYPPTDGAAKPAPGERPAVTMLMLEAHCRDITIKALQERMHYSLAVLSPNSRAKNPRYEEMCNVLKQRAQQIQSGIQMLQTERETYEYNVRVMDAMVRTMDDWKSNIRIPEDPDGAGTKPEEIIVPQDDLTAQLLDAHAKDLAAEDTLNALDELLQKEIINVDTYLKQIRKVGREQFFARALIMKADEMHRKPRLS